MGQDGAKVGQDGAKVGEDGAKMGRDGAKMGQDGAKMRQDGVKIVTLAHPGAYLGTSWRHLGAFGPLLGSTLSSK